MATGSAVVSPIAFMLCRLIRFLKFSIAGSGVKVDRSILFVRLYVAVFLGIHLKAEPTSLPSCSETT
jgi:hypothetical protein